MLNPAETSRAFKYVISSIWHDASNRNQKLRRLCMGVAWQCWKRSLSAPVTVSLFNGLKFRAYPDCSVSASVFYSRVPNFRCIQFLRKHVSEGTLLDVGANVGLFTLMLADKIQHAVLFEPNPIAASRARENLQRNGLTFEVREQALSDRTGSIAFENAGGASPINRTVDGFTPSVPTITVERTTVDEFLRTSTLPEPIKLVKIDVEGHENAVIRGMAACLQTVRPLVMFEYLARTKLKETFQLFSQAGYRVIALSNQGELLWASLGVAPSERAEEFVPSSREPALQSEWPID